MLKVIRVLIVEDSPDDAELLILHLEREQYRVVSQRVETAADMTIALQETDWDVIIADYSLPTFDAIAALRLMKAQGLDLPFIIVSGTIGEETAVAAMKAGAHDYLLKKSLTRLVPAIERELREAQLRAQFQAARQRIEALAFRDPLTGLPNKNEFLRYLEAWLAQRSPTSPFSVLYLNIDRYQSVKYGFGHQQSDQFLIEVVHRLQTLNPPPDYLARVAEDSFALLLTHCPTQDALGEQVQQVHQKMTDLFQIGYSFIHTSATIGVADNRVSYQQAIDLLRAADTAMYGAKQQKQPTVIFSEQMQSEARRQLQIEADLQQAISGQELQLHYQPVVTLAPIKVVGFEALIRWQHPTQGWLAPEVFIGAAERTGLITPLGEWCLTTACHHMRQWQHTLADFLPLTISVNLSSLQLEQPNLANNILQICQHSHHPNLRLGVEITESLLMNNAPQAIANLRQLRQAGIRVSVDDFGTGYSSLAYLHQFPIDTLKIDRSFIQAMTHGAKRLKFVETIIALAHTLDLEVVAEGIETANQLHMLQALNCDLGQGFCFAKPTAYEDIPALLNRMTQPELPAIEGRC